MAGTGKPPEQYQIEDFVADESFINYFFQLNAEDVFFWEKWLLANPACKDSVDAAKDMLRNLTLTLPDRELEEETAKINAAIVLKAPLKGNQSPAIFRLLRFGAARRRQKILVPLLLIVLAGGYFVARMLIHRERIIEKFNNGSDPIVLSLTDGTTVTLAPQSVLRYASGFGDKDRAVWLDGEASFDVPRKTDHPFEVYEADIVATVLGTKFTVKKQPGDSVWVVDLIKGRLKVENINGNGQPVKSIILNPDERVIYNRHDHRLYKERWQPQAELPVQVNHIGFQRNNFDEIAAKIKAVFGLTVINRSKKRSWMFSGEFENATAQDIIRNICVVEGLNFETTGDTLLIK